jgi:hypothetical protein
LPYLFPSPPPFLIKNFTGSNKSSKSITRRFDGAPNFSGVCAGRLDILFGSVRCLLLVAVVEEEVVIRLKNFQNLNSWQN